MQSKNIMILAVRPEGIPACNTSRGDGGQGTYDLRIKRLKATGLLLTLCLQ